MLEVVFPSENELNAQTHEGRAILADGTRVAEFIVKSRAVGSLGDSLPQDVAKQVDLVLALEKLRAKEFDIAGAYSLTMPEFNSMTSEVERLVLSELAKIAID